MSSSSTVVGTPNSSRRQACTSHLAPGKAELGPGEAQAASDRLLLGVVDQNAGLEAAPAPWGLVLLGLSSTLS
jgi:hypothetical protein